MDKIDRRKFIKNAAITGGAVIGSSLIPITAEASSKHDPAEFNKNWSVLFDATKCIGCRTCELACHTANKMKESEVDFTDLRVLETKRRTDESSNTVINRYYPYERDARMNNKPVHIKRQCMHCNTPACVSACIVAALRKTPEGPVYYEESACIGCRYCMIACQFQVPVYEFEKPLFPIVLKCTLCYDKDKDKKEEKKNDRIPEKLPACVEACPQEAMMFGRREELLKIGHEKIRKNPETYDADIYGEHVLGGTSWLYLTPVPSEELGLPEHPDTPAPQLSETIQHSVFKSIFPFAIPLFLYGMLGVLMWRNSRQKNSSDDGEEG
jgi:formate dehydrogenase iron-sulfur subunit